MRRRLRDALLLLTVLAAPLRVAHADDYKLAPSMEELDRRADDYITGRRIVAILLVGGTLVGGMLGSVMRRRARRRAAEEHERD